MKTNFIRLAAIFAALICVFITCVVPASAAGASYTTGELFSPVFDMYITYQEPFGATAHVPITKRVSGSNFLSSQGIPPGATITLPTGRTLNVLASNNDVILPSTGQSGLAVVRTYFSAGTLSFPSGFTLSFDNAFLTNRNTIPAVAFSKDSSGSFAPWNATVTVSFDYYTSDGEHGSITTDPSAVALNSDNKYALFTEDFWISFVLANDIVNITNYNATFTNVINTNTNESLSYDIYAFFDIDSILDINATAYEFYTTVSEIDENAVRNAYDRGWAAGMKEANENGTFNITGFLSKSLAGFLSFEFWPGISFGGIFLSIFVCLFVYFLIRHAK